MDPARFDPFARAFVAWVESGGFKKIQVKKHPHASCGLVEELLEKYEEVGGGTTAEGMIADLEAGTVRCMLHCTSDV